MDNLTKQPRATSALTRIELTKEQDKLWTETRTGLLLTCPMFSHLLYSMLSVSKHNAFFTESAEIPIAATDSYEIILKPSTYFKLDLRERIFVAAHEVLHCVYNHCALMHQWRTIKKVMTASGKILDYDQDTMNRAMDYVINDLLVQSKIGSFPKCGLHDPNIGNKDESVIDVYEKLYKQQPPDQDGFDIVLEPGAGQGMEPDEAISQRSEHMWHNELASAMASAKVQGKLPLAIEQAFGQVIEGVVDWKEHIQAFFARKVGSGGIDWKRPDRQLIVRGLGMLDGPSIYAPGKSGRGAGTIVVGMDSSGSIYADETLIDRFMGELSGILESINPRRIVVVWCDSKVQRVDEVEDGADIEAIRHRGAKGGGGTRFEPVFEYISEQQIEPDALIYLTDGYGSFPSSEPDYPVLWGNISPNVKYPFGEVVDVPVSK